ncbi:stage II sporulation protein E [Bacillota bacterium LX-D]|nr:stage II sporulation protein E [Bacillota bacterium LX-D]
MQGDYKFYTYQRTQQAQFVDTSNNPADEDFKVKSCSILSKSASWFSRLSIESIFIFGISLILSRAQLIGNISPFALPFYGAVVTSYRKYLWPMLIANLIGQLFVHQGLELAINITLFCIFAFWQLLFPINFTKRWIILPTAVFIFAVTVKTAWMALNSFVLYNMMTIFVEAVICAGLTLVYLSCLNVLKAKKIPSGLSLEESVCAVIFCLSITAGVLDLFAWKYSIGSILSRYLILMAALIGGGGSGAVLGSVLGILPSLVEVHVPTLVGIYAFSGMLAGTMMQWNKLGVGAGFLVGNLFLSIYLLEPVTLVNSLTETALALFILCITPQRLVLRLQSVPNCQGAIQENEHQRYEQLLRMRLLDAGKSFASLANTFLEHTAAVEEAEEDKIKDLFGKVKKMVCPECSISAVCWEQDSHTTYKSIFEALNFIEKEGNLTIEDLPFDLSRRCLRCGEMTVAVNCLYDLYQNEIFWRKKLRDNQGLLAVQLEAAAKVLKNTAEELRFDGIFYEELEICIADALDKAAFNIQDVQVWKDAETERLEINLNLSACTGGRPCENRIAPMLSELLGQSLKLECPNCGNLEGNLHCRLRLIPCPTLQITTGLAQTAPKDQQVCGDSCTYFDLPDGKYALALSDGMGVGFKAAKESQTALVLLEKLLQAGFDQYLAIKMLNSLLILQMEEETFATVDLAVVDRYSGETKFLKMGSAPSFIIRNGEALIVKNNTLPAGIIDDIPLEPVNEGLQAGDILVMITDGILELNKTVLNQEEWLKAILLNGLMGTPEQMADQILNQVKANVRGNLKDDLSVLVAKIDLV